MGVTRGEHCEECGTTLLPAGQRVPAGIYLRVDDGSFHRLRLDSSGILPASYDGHVALYRAAAAPCACERRQQHEQRQQHQRVVARRGHDRREESAAAELATAAEWSAHLARVERSGAAPRSAASLLPANAVVSTASGGPARPHAAGVTGR